MLNEGINSNNTLLKLTTSNFTTNLDRFILLSAVVILSARLSNYERYPRGSDPILPAVLELREEKEEALLHALITDLDPNVLVFKLAPAYTLYLAARYRASTHYRPELTPNERACRLTLMLAKVAAMIQNVTQVSVSSKHMCNERGVIGVEPSPSHYIQNYKKSIFNALENLKIVHIYWESSGHFLK